MKTKQLIVSSDEFSSDSDWIHSFEKCIQIMKLYGVNSDKAQYDQFRYMFSRQHFDSELSVTFMYFELYGAKDEFKTNSFRFIENLTAL